MIQYFFPYSLHKDMISQKYDAATLYPGAMLLLVPECGVATLYLSVPTVGNKIGCPKFHKHSTHIKDPVYILPAEKVKQFCALSEKK